MTSNIFMGDSQNNNFIDEEFQAILFPIGSIQKLCLLSKFSIRNNLIYPNSLFYNLVCFILIILQVLLYVFRFFLPFYYKLKDISRFFEIIMILCTLMHIFGIILFFIVNVINNINKNNIIVIKYLENAHKIIKTFIFENNNMRNFKIVNWVYVIFIYFSCCLVSFANFLSMDDTTWDENMICYLISLIYFDVTVVYWIRLIKLMRKNLKLWILEVRFYSKCCILFDKDGIETSKNVIWGRFLEAYQGLITAFSFFKKIFQIPVRSLHCLLLQIRL